MRNFIRLFTLLIVVNLVGCGASLPTIKPYKMDIQQGNVVTSEMLLQLRPGMTKSQVQFIMGTPLLVDSFRTNRWDYFYQLRKQGKIVSQRRVILDFEKDLLKRVRGDVVPKGSTVEDVANQLEAEAEAGNAEKADEPVDNKAEPIVVPIEAPDIKPVEEISGSTESTLAPDDAAENLEQPASVLAVPISIGPSKAPSEKVEVENGVEAPAAEQKGESEPSAVVEAAETAPEETAVNQKNTPESSRASQEKSLLDAELEKGIPVAPPANEPAKSVLSPNDNKRVFRLDRQLDAGRVAPEVTAVSPEPPLQESAVQEVKESQAATLPNEEEYGFFERMLEKIGF